ncbi:MAG: sigma-54 dependent transcriptional regulator [Candidatus Brocadiia bacterium]
MHRILVVDDEESVCWAFRDLLTSEGYEVETAPSAEEGLLRAKKAAPHLLFLDIRLPGLDGLSAIDSFKKVIPGCPIIVMTGHGTTQTAIEAMMKGAADYLLKPIDDIDLTLRLVRKYLAASTTDSEVAGIRETLLERADVEIMVGRSVAMQSVFKQIGALAGSDVTVLMRGESGTGKELCARLIHFNSERRRKPFVIVNCASLPESLLESELFGHEKGSFTGAYRDRKGYFEIADGGTIFLDEVGDFSPISQVKLLNFLETKSFERVGGTTPIKVDVRIMAATNRNIDEMVASGTFREDLFYRLDVVEIRMPTLRERREDVTMLTAYFLLNLEKKTAISKKMSSEAMEILKEYPFPGNVRELRNAIERAWFMCKSDTILAENLPPRLTEKPTTVDEKAPVDEVVSSVCRQVFVEGKTEDLYDRVMSVFEKPLVIWALKLTDGNQVQASRVLGINRSTLRKLAEKYSL